MKIGLYADINPNLIDGSTIWLQDLSLVIMSVSNVALTVIAREAVNDDTIVAPIRDAGANIEILTDLDTSSRVDPADTAQALALVAHDTGLDLLIVRGDALIEYLSNKTDMFACPIWAYWLQRPDFTSPDNDIASLAVINAFPKIIVQSRDHKAVLETLYRVPARRVVALPPMIPPEAWSIDRVRPKRLSLIYSGKMDAAYNVEAYLDLPQRLAKRGVVADLSVLGNKFNLKPGDPEFKRRMKEKLGSTSNATWLGGMDRSSALQSMASASLGLCVRHDDFASSLQISTKLIEFCALGVPPICNRTLAHQELLGRDYPYFADTIEELIERVVDTHGTPETAFKLGKTLRDRATPYCRDYAGSDLVRTIKDQRQRKIQNHERPIKLLFAGHDFKFLNALFPDFLTDQRFDIKFDRWEKNRTHAPEQSEALVNWADVIFCEWCSGAAIWYSRKALPGQRLIVRLHRFELFSPDPGNVDFDRVDRLIVVSDHFRNRCITELAVDPDKVDVLPQFVDCRELDRPKHPWAAYTLGFVGINSFRHKRFDRAVDLLESLRAKDERWRLRVRSVMPWKLPWIWRSDEQREKYRALFARIADNRSLRDAIIFDAPGQDMEEWYRNVAFIVSTSESEGCHTAVAEGLASGAYPLILDWPGADSLYPIEYISDTTSGLSSIAESLAMARIGNAETATLKSKAASFDIAQTREHFTRLFTQRCLKGLPPAVHAVDDYRRAQPASKNRR